ncbi:MAG TPA: hypothetical protein VJB59_04420 [Bdellovibrionota bacterium]|nr:hypothetical protein [Bdellovibrionota bacterium]
MKFVVLVSFCTLLMLQSAFATTFREDRRYEYNIFGSREACTEYRKRWPRVNCWRYANFSKEGRAFVLYSDIPNVGTYFIDGKTIQVTFSQAEDVPSEVVFTLSDDQSSVTSDFDGQVWIRSR